MKAKKILAFLISAVMAVQCVPMQVWAEKTNNNATDYELQTLDNICVVSQATEPITLYIEDGSIVISVNENKVYYTQGDISEECNAIILRNRDAAIESKNSVVIHSSENTPINLTVDNVNINAISALKIAGDGILNLEIDGKSIFRSGNTNAGIEVGSDSTLCINDTDDDGYLYAYGSGSWDSGAGIGSSNNNNCGTIIINNGTITAKGGWWSACIGGGKSGSAGSIIINDGTIVAQSDWYGCGIGSGNYNKSGGRIIINGGNITASSNVHGAGIGGAEQGFVDEVIINGGIITSEGRGSESGMGDASGDSSSIVILDGDITVFGGKVDIGFSNGAININSITGRNADGTFTSTNHIHTFDSLISEMPATYESPRTIAFYCLDISCPKTGEVITYSFGSTLEFQSPVETPENQIPEDAVCFNSHYYKVYTITSSNTGSDAWREADLFCKSLGGHLAVISSQEENDFLHSYVNSINKPNSYFGYTDEETEGTWKWISSAETSTYENWAHGEPSTSSEDYAMFYTGAYFANGEWNDGNFGSGNYICEWEAVQTSPITTTWDTSALTLSEGDSYALNGEILSSVPLQIVHLAIVREEDQTVGIDYFRQESINSTVFSLRNIPGIMAGQTLNGLKVTNDQETLALTPGNYLLRLWAKNTEGETLYATKKLTVLENVITYDISSAYEPSAINVGDSVRFSVASSEPLSDVYIQFMLPNGNWMKAEDCAANYGLIYHEETDGLHTYHNTITLTTSGNYYDNYKRYFRFVYTTQDGRVVQQDADVLTITPVEREVSVKVISGGHTGDSGIVMNNAELRLAFKTEGGLTPKTVTAEFLSGNKNDFDCSFDTDKKHFVIKQKSGRTGTYEVKFAVTYSDNSTYFVTQTIAVYAVQKTTITVTATEKGTNKVVPIEDATVEIYSDINGKNLITTLSPTDAKGKTVYTWNGIYKQVYAVAYKKVASEKTTHPKVGSYEKYYLELRSDDISSSNGSIQLDAVTGSEVTLGLIRPKFHLNLTVAYFVPEDNAKNRKKYTQTGAFDDYYDEVAILMEETNKYLMEATDGYFCIDDVYIGSVDNELDIDIAITKNDINIHYSWHSSAYVKTFINSPIWGLPRGVHLGKYPLERNDEETNMIYPFWEYEGQSKVVVHELGHYIFGFLDEYLTPDDKTWVYDIDGEYDDGTTNTERGANAKQYFGLMEYQYDRNWEMSTKSHYSGYLDSIPDWQKNKSVQTAQYAQKYQGKQYMSCWEWLQNTYFNCYDGVIDCDYIYGITVPTMTEVGLKVLEDNNGNPVKDQNGNDKMVFSSQTGSKYETARLYKDFTDEVTIHDMRTAASAVSASSYALYASSGEPTYDVRTPIAYAGVIYDAEAQAYVVKLIPQMDGEIRLYDVTGEDRMEIALTLADDGCCYGTLASFPEDGTSVVYEIEVCTDDIIYNNTFTAYVTAPALEYHPGETSSGMDFLLDFSFTELNRVICTEMQFTDHSTDTKNAGTQLRHIALYSEGEYEGYITSNAYGDLDLTSLSWYHSDGTEWTELESLTEIGMDGVLVSAAIADEGFYMIFGDPAAEESTLEPVSNMSAAANNNNDGGVYVTFTDPNSSDAVYGYQLYYSDKPFTDVAEANRNPVLFRHMPVSVSMENAGETYYFAVAVCGLDGSISAVSETVSCTVGVWMMEGSEIPVSWQQKYCLWDIQGEIIDDKDNDCDGLTNLEEYRAGTAPLNADTDGDGVKDGTEITLGLDPLKGKVQDYKEAFSEVDIAAEEIRCIRNSKGMYTVSVTVNNTTGNNAENIPVKLYCGEICVWNWAIDIAAGKKEILNVTLDNFDVMTAVIDEENLYDTNAVNNMVSCKTYEEADTEDEDLTAFTYEVNAGGQATITSYIGENSSISIPSEIDGYTVTAIGERALENNETITSVVIPDSVESIGAYAFADCISLEKVVLPSGLKRLETDTFARCCSLAEINIPANLEYMGKGVFYHCCSLPNVTLPNTLTSIGEYAFSNCYGMTEIVVPDSVTFLGDCTFDSSCNLKKLVLPNNITALPYAMCWSCERLEEVVMPDTVTVIGNNAFSRCFALKEIDLPDTVESIEDYAFSDATSLSEITIPASVKYMGYHAFYNCVNMKDMTFLGNVPSEWTDYAIEGQRIDFVIHYPEGNTSGWTSPVWIAPDGVKFRTEKPAEWEEGFDYVVVENVAPDDLDGLYGESYPVSTLFPEVTSGELLKGTVVAGWNGREHCWTNESNAARAFDGDVTTHFDPFETSSASWCGVILDQPYRLTEIRLQPRIDNLERMAGGAVQGSNDGITWNNIVYITGTDGAPAGNIFHCFTPETSEFYTQIYGIDLSVYWCDEGAYRYYRYVNLECNHGDVAEIELYGVPVSKCGDVDNDGTVTKKDADLLSAYFTGKDVTFNRETADVDNNGSLTRRDAMILSRYIAGWPGYSEYILGEAGLGGDLIA